MADESHSGGIAKASIWSFLFIAQFAQAVTGFGGTQFIIWHSVSAVAFGLLAARAWARR